MEHQWSLPQMEDPFQIYEYSLFLQNWGIRRCLSSAYYPQSNGQAGAAVKTAKRILMGNTDTAGHINYDQSAHAFMMHWNTPLQDVGISPAEMLFGKLIKDHLPSHKTSWQLGQNGKKYVNCGRKLWPNAMPNQQSTTTSTHRCFHLSHLVITFCYKTRWVTTQIAGRRPASLLRPLATGSTKLKLMVVIASP